MDVDSFIKRAHSKDGMIRCIQALLEDDDAILIINRGLTSSPDVESQTYLHHGGMTVEKAYYLLECLQNYLIGNTK
jgi:hypothetical protein